MDPPGRWYPEAATNLNLGAVAGGEDVQQGAWDRTAMTMRIQRAWRYAVAWRAIAAAIEHEERLAQQASFREVHLRLDAVALQRAASIGIPDGDDDFDLE